LTQCFVHYHEVFLPCTTTTNSFYGTIGYNPGVIPVGVSRPKRVSSFMQTQKQMKLSNCGRDSVVYLNGGRFAEIVEIDGDKLLCALYQSHILHPFYL